MTKRTAFSLIVLFLPLFGFAAEQTDNEKTIESAKSYVTQATKTLNDLRDAEADSKYKSRLQVTAGQLKPRLNQLETLAREINETASVDSIGKMKANLPSFPTIKDGEKNTDFETALKKQVVLFNMEIQKLDKAIRAKSTATNSEIKVLGEKLTTGKGSTLQTDKASAVQAGIKEIQAILDQEFEQLDIADTTPAFEPADTSDVAMESIAHIWVYDTHKVGETTHGWKVDKVFKPSLIQLYDKPSKWGFYAEGLVGKDNRGNKIALLVCRGTDDVGDVFADTNPGGVGVASYNAMLPEIKEWLKDKKMRNKYSIMLTGHSLGGALVQWFAAGLAGSNKNFNFDDGNYYFIRSLVTFQSPGISREMAGRSIPGLKAKHYVAVGDIVSNAGLGYIAGEVYLCNVPENVKTLSALHGVGGKKSVWKLTLLKKYTYCRSISTAEYSDDNFVLPNVEGLRLSGSVIAKKIREYGKKQSDTNEDGKIGKNKVNFTAAKGWWKAMSEEFEKIPNLTKNVNEESWYAKYERVAKLYTGGRKKFENERVGEMKLGEMKLGKLADFAARGDSLFAPVVYDVLFNMPLY